MVDTQRKFYKRRQFENENNYAYATELRAIAKEIFVDMTSSTIEKYVKDNFQKDCEIIKTKSMEQLLSESEEIRRILKALARKKQTSPRSRPNITFDEIKKSVNESERKGKKEKIGNVKPNEKIPPV